MDGEPGRDPSGGPVGVPAAQQSDLRGALRRFLGGRGWGPSPWDPLVRAAAFLLFVVYILFRERERMAVTAGVFAVFAVVYLVRAEFLRRRQNRRAREDS